MTTQKTQMSMGTFACNTEGEYPMSKSELISKMRGERCRRIEAAAEHIATLNPSDAHAELREAARLRRRINRMVAQTFSGPTT